MFHGSLTALITPFRNGEVDEPAFQKFVDWQIREGTDALVPCGTTGESPTLAMTSICGWWSSASRRPADGCR